MEIVTLEWAYNNKQTIITGECPKAYCVLHKQTEVNYGTQNDCDLEYCREHNIPAYLMDRGGGTIVCAAGNIGISTITPLKDGWQCGKFVKAFIAYLKTFNLNVKTEKNDILIDGYKVASSVEIALPNDLKRVYSTYQISINQDIDAIKHICKKEMVKVPKGLSDYGFTTEQILTWCENYFDESINSLRKK